MDEINGVAGKMGEVSGSPFTNGVAGKMGEVSGAPATLAEVQRFLFQDRQTDRILSLESKVCRLENEILGIAKWLDSRLTILEDRIRSGNVEDRLKVLESGVRELRNAKPSNV